MSRLGGLGSLAPLAPMSTRSFDASQSADNSDFGALLDDILDSPTASIKKSTRGSNKKGKKTARKSFNDSADDLNDSMASSLASPKTKPDALETSLNISESISPVRETTAQDRRHSPVNATSVDLSGTNDDLEDSILGGLLGPSNKKSSTKSSGKSASIKSKTQSLDEGLLPTSDYGNTKSITEPSSATTRGGFSRPRVDQAKSPERDDRSDDSSPEDVISGFDNKGIVSKKPAEMNWDNDKVYGDDLRGNESSKGVNSHRGVPASATQATTSQPAPRESGADEVDMGFIPSFLDPGRPARQRRGLSVGPRGGAATTDKESLRPGSSGGGGLGSDAMDELDRAFGFGGGAKPRAIVDPFASTSQRPIVDPFASATSRLSGAGAGAGSTGRGGLDGGGPGRMAGTGVGAGASSTISPKRVVKVGTGVISDSDSDDPPDMATATAAKASSQPTSRMQASSAYPTAASSTASMASAGKAQQDDYDEGSRLNRVGGLGGLSTANIGFGSSAWSKEPPGAEKTEASADIAGRIGFNAKNGGPLSAQAGPSGLSSLSPSASGGGGRESRGGPAGPKPIAAASRGRRKGSFDFSSDSEDDTGSVAVREKVGAGGSGGGGSGGAHLAAESVTGVTSAAGGGSGGTTSANAKDSTTGLSAGSRSFGLGSTGLSSASADGYADTVSDRLSANAPGVAAAAAPAPVAASSSHLSSTASAVLSSTSSEPYSAAPVTSATSTTFGSSRHGSLSGREQSPTGRSSLSRHSGTSLSVVTDPDTLATAGGVAQQSATATASLSGKDGFGSSGGGLGGPQHGGPLGGGRDIAGLSVSFEASPVRRSFTSQSGGLSGATTSAAAATSAAAVAGSPAWLSGSAATATAAGAGGGMGLGMGMGLGSSMGSPADRESLQTIRRLQEELDTRQLKGEAVERQLRMEVEGLRVKLSASQTTAAAGAPGQGSGLADSMGSGGGEAYGGSTSLAAARNEEQARFFEQQSMQLLREQGDLRRLVAQLEAEVARLKDEATLQLLKHKEELKLMREKHEADERELERRKEGEVALIERRHADTVTALKKIHEDEIESIKQRMREGAALEQITGQIQTASGSIRLIEEQLNVRYKGLEAAREGQMEARERLVREMEEAARARADVAEAEGYRLKGMLIHMEHVVGNLRSQGADEKERLRHEHQRLQTMQAALEAERQALHSARTEEMGLVRQKARDLEAEARRLADKERDQAEAAATATRALEADRAEFAKFVAANAKASEAAAARLSSEEERIRRARDDWVREKQQWEQRRVAAQREAQAAEEMRREAKMFRADAEAERRALQQGALELQRVSEQIQREAAALDVKEQALAARERVLQDGLAHMESSARQLAHRETQVTDTFRQLEKQQLQLEHTDNSLIEKRLSIATAQRELLNRQASGLSSSYAAGMGMGGRATSSSAATRHSVGSTADWAVVLLKDARFGESSSGGGGSGSSSGSAARAGLPREHQNKENDIPDQQAIAAGSLSSPWALSTAKQPGDIAGRRQGQGGGSSSWMLAFEAKLSETAGAKSLRTRAAAPEDLELAAARKLLNRDRAAPGTGVSGGRAFSSPAVVGVTSRSEDWGRGARAGWSMQRFLENEREFLDQLHSLEN